MQTKGIRQRVATRLLASILPGFLAIAAAFPAGAFALDPECSAEVTVAKSQGAGPPVDSGQAFDATQCN